MDLPNAHFSPPLLVSANGGGGGECGNARDPTKPNGRLTCGNRQYGALCAEMFQKWLFSSDRHYEHHPLTLPAPNLREVQYPSEEYRPAVRLWDGSKEPGWYTSAREWEEICFEWTVLGVPLQRFHHHVLCTFIMGMMSGALPPCWVLGGFH